MSKFYAVVSTGNVVHTTKEVKSNVIKVVDGVEQLFDDLSDHIEIENFDVCQPGDKKNEDGSYTSPGVDAVGNSRWFDMETGLLMEHVYNEGGNIIDSQEVV